MPPRGKYACGLCGARGHNSRTCTEEVATHWANGLRFGGALIIGHSTGHIHLQCDCGRLFMRTTAAMMRAEDMESYVTCNQGCAVHIAAAGRHAKKRCPVMAVGE